MNNQKLGRRWEKWKYIWTIQRKEADGLREAWVHKGNHILANAQARLVLRAVQDKTHPNASEQVTWPWMYVLMIKQHSDTS